MKNKKTPKRPPKRSLNRPKAKVNKRPSRKKTIKPSRETSVKSRKKVVVRRRRQKVIAHSRRKKIITHQRKRIVGIVKRKKAITRAIKTKKTTGRGRATVKKRGLKKAAKIRAAIYRKKPTVSKKTGGIAPPRYLLNRHWQFIQELRDLVLKSSPAEKSEILARLNKIGRIKLAVITGIFLNKESNESIPTDLFIVADDIDRRKFNNFLRYLEAEVGGEVRFVMMEREEFQYRYSMFDRFVRVLLEGPHEKLINRMGV